jgi:cytochrome c oxidase subunit 2
LYGEEVLLEGGAAATADEAYLRESILSPGAQMVAGYKPIMPAFQGHLSEAELEALVDYIRSIAD